MLTIGTLKTFQYINILTVATHTCWMSSESAIVCRFCGIEYYNNMLKNVSKTKCCSVIYNTKQLHIFHAYITDCTCCLCIYSMHTSQTARVVCAYIPCIHHRLHVLFVQIDTEAKANIPFVAVL